MAIEGTVYPGISPDVEPFLSAQGTVDAAIELFGKNGKLLLGHWRGFSQGGVTTAPESGQQVREASDFLISRLRHFFPDLDTLLREREQHFEEEGMELQWPMRELESTRQYLRGLQSAHKFLQESKPA